MTDDFKTIETPHTRQFPTGAVRGDATGKGRYDLIPPMMLRRWAELMERGARSYGDNNWQKGMCLKSFIDSAFRHLIQLAEGDRSEDHAAAVFFNVAGLEWTRAEILAGRLPVNLADGSIFAGPALEYARSCVGHLDDRKTVPAEDAYAYRQRMNRPWTHAELGTVLDPSRSPERDDRLHPLMGPFDPAGDPLSPPDADAPHWTLTRPPTPAPDAPFQF